MPNVAYLRMPKNAHALAVKTIHPKYLKEHVAHLGAGEIDEAACSARWFQPGFTREQVKKALARAPDGSFILSQRPQDPDWKFHLSLKSGRHLNHFVVVNGSFGFTFKGVQLAFPTLSEFVAYYAKYESSLPERLWVTLELTEKSDQSGIPKSTGAVQSRATESSVVASVHQGTDAADLAPKDDLLDGKERSHEEEMYLVLQEGIKRGWFGVENLPYTLGGPVTPRTFVTPMSPTLDEQKESQSFMRAAMAALASQSQPKYDFAQSKRHSRGGARDHQGQDQSRGPLQQPRRMRSMQMQGDPGSIVQHRYAESRSGGGIHVYVHGGSSDDVRVDVDDETRFGLPTQRRDKWQEDDETRYGPPVQRRWQEDHETRNRPQTQRHDWWQEDAATRYGPPTQRHDRWCEGDTEPRVVQVEETYEEESDSGFVAEEKGSFYPETSRVVSVEETYEEEYIE